MSNFNRKRSFNWYNKIPPKINTTKKEVVKYEMNPCFGYIGYDYYFTEKDPEKVKYILKNVQTIESYINRNLSEYNSEEIIESQHYKLDIQHFIKDPAVIEEWESIKDDLINNSGTVINSLGLAMHQVCYSIHEDDIRQVSIIYCRILNHEPILRIKHLRASAHGKLVSVKGTIIKASTVDLCNEVLEFSCSFCNGTQIVVPIDGGFTEPENCPSKGCHARGNFKPMLDSSYSRCVSMKSLKLLELVGEEVDSNGRMPRTIECQVKNDLVGLCVPGDDVILTGELTVRTRESSFMPGKGKMQQSLFELFLKVNNVQNEKTKSDLFTTFRSKDCKLIEKIQAEPNLFRFLVQSLCPSIYGHEIVKAGLLLALFGGTQINNGRRSDSHVLIVGDPGLGKSQMLLACYKVAPRGVYVGGNTSTNSGLTVTMCKEPSGEYRLEAGALLLADQGLCCIDEFDKMSAQQACLLEVMEQQCISIAKAGVVCSVPTRASVIAAANPICGHYNKAKTVSENLKMSSPMLSRFDLVFIILDKPDQQQDAMLSEHVLSMRSGQPSNMSDTSDPGGITNTNLQLKDRLRLRRNETINHLPTVLFKKYLAYTRKSIHPQLTPEAKDAIQRFYVQMRSQYRKGDAHPVTARQLESLVRLTQARAKLECREKATAQDARDVIEIMQHCIVDIYSDDLGVLDFTRSQNGAGISNQKAAKALLKVLQRKADAMQRNSFLTKEMKTFAASIGIQGEQFFNAIESLNLQGFLLKKPGSRYQLTICG